jgi:hypothetical protein
MPEYLVDNYNAQMWSTRPTTSRDPNSPVTALYLKQGATFRAWAYFYPDGTPLQTPRHDAARGGVYLFYNLSQFPVIVDVVRNEKPIKVYWFADNNAGIAVSEEPIGEQEG